MAAVVKINVLKIEIIDLGICAKSINKKKNNIEYPGKIKSEWWFLLKKEQKTFSKHFSMTSMILIRMDLTGLVLIFTGW